MSSSKIKNIIFDLGNVLYDIDISLGFNTLYSLIKPDYQYVDWKEIFEPVLFKYETGRISTEYFVDFILKYCTRDVMAVDVQLAWNKMLIQMQPARIAFLKKISSNHDLFLLSNINDLHYNYFINSLPPHFNFIDFEALFVKCYYSHQIGFRKPDKEAFRIIIEENNIDISTTIFVDDVMENIHSASELGMQTLLIDPNIAGNQLDTYFNVQSL